MRTPRLVGSTIWEFFEKCDATKKKAMCNTCFNILSYETNLTNLRSHLMKQHKPEFGKFIKMRRRIKLQLGRNSSLPERESNEIPRNTLIWKSFEKTNDRSKTANCNFCGTKLSYGTTTDNLRNHLRFMHTIEYNKILNSKEQPDSATASENSMSDDSDEEKDATVGKRGNVNDNNGNACPIKLENEEVEGVYNSPSTPDEKREINDHNNDLHIWNFFEKSNDDEGIAICNDCSDELIYKNSTRNLQEHLRIKHPPVYNNYLKFTKQLDPPTKVHTNSKSEDENAKQLETQSRTDKLIWSYFENTDRKITAFCNKCSITLSYQTSITNLEEHLKAEHKSDFIDYTNLKRKLESTIREDSASKNETENLCNSPRTKESASESECNTSMKTERNENTPIIDGILWNFFDKSKHGNKVAKCNYCSKKLSYRTTITNLKAHLRLKHIAEYEMFVSLSKALDSAAVENERAENTEKGRIKNRPSYSRIWKCFEKTDPVKCVATCNYCSSKLSYKSTATNLKVHLELRHSEKYKEIFEVKELPSTRKRRRSPSMSDRSTTSESEIYNGGATDIDEDSPPNRIRKDLSKSPIDTGNFEAINIKEKDTLEPKRSLKRRISSENADDDVPDQAQETEAEDVWSYFEKIPSNRARCILCKETFNRHLPFLAKHMTEKHRKVALDLPSDSDEDQNCYTEVVYLEEEQPRSVETKPKQTKKTTVAKRPRLSPRYEFVNKLNEVEIPPKNNEVDDEIENFGRYVIGLLKKMPKDVSTQLQMDIISMIMTAKLKLETSTTESVNVSMSNVEDGVIVTPSNVIVTTPSNVIHTTQNNESLPTLVIGVENES